ncbi:MAG: DUF554 domain-containing protein [Bacillota bacterium]|nr:DUF554 domain-containing protein [Bacillota bacterium]
MYFLGIGTVLNMLMIIAGGIIGTFFGRKFPERFREIFMQAAALVVFFIGVTGVIGAAATVEGGKLAISFTMMTIASLFAGSAIGELLNIEGALERGGAWLQAKMKRLFKNEDSHFAEGFCMAGILYCTGAMAIMGALNDGLLADPSILISKGVIDGVTAIVFAATLGVGVLFSCLLVGVYQGTITLAASLLAPLLTETVIAQMSAVGSLLIVAIAFSISDIKKFRIGNMLPAIFVPLLWYAIASLF